MQIGSMAYDIDQEDTILLNIWPSYEEAADSIEQFWMSKNIMNDTLKIQFILESIYQIITGNGNLNITNPYGIILTRTSQNNPNLIRWFIDSSDITSILKDRLLGWINVSELYTEDEIIEKVNDDYLNDSILYFSFVNRLPSSSKSFLFIKNKIINSNSLKHIDHYKHKIFHIWENSTSISLKDSISTYLNGWTPNFVVQQNKNSETFQIRWDSILTTMKEKMEEAKSQRRDSINNASMDSVNWSQLKKSEVKRFGDTTLLVAWVGLDYRWFSDYTNTELIHYLDTVNMDHIYKSDTGALNPLSYSYNSNPNIIHLRKVIQIIGDRYLNGELHLNSQETLILNNTIAKYVSYYLEPRINFVQPWNNRRVIRLSQNSKEAKDQLLRLWTLPLPYYFDWIDDINSLNDVLSTAKKQIRIMAHDSIIMRVIKRAIQADSTSVKNEYISLLLNLANNSGTEEWLKDNRKMPRRPYYTDSQALDWKIRMIEPGIKIIQDIAKKGR